MLSSFQTAMQQNLIFLGFGGWGEGDLFYANYTCTIEQAGGTVLEKCTVNAILIFCIFEEYF